MFRDSLLMIPVSSQYRNYASQYPLASVILKTDCCVDDIVTGAQWLEEALKLQNDFIEL